LNEVGERERERERTNCARAVNSTRAKGWKKKKRKKKEARARKGGWNRRELKVSVRERKGPELLFRVGGYLPIGGFNVGLIFSFLFFSFLFSQKARRQ
jgi:hypothetical protein